MVEKQDAMKWWLGHPFNADLRRACPQKIPKTLQHPEPSPQGQSTTGAKFHPFRKPQEGLAHPRLLSCNLPPSLTHPVNPWLGAAPRTGWPWTTPLATWSAKSPEKGRSSSLGLSMVTLLARHQSVCMDCLFAFLWQT